MWRRTLESLGLQPARRDRPQQRRAAQAGVDARRSAPRHPRRHAARPRRRDVLPEPERRDQALDAATGDCSGSIAAQLPERPRRVLPVAVDQPQSRDLRRLDHRQRAPTTTSTRSTRAPASWRGKRRSSTTGRGAQAHARARSSPTARSSRAAAASPRAAPRRA